MKAQDLATIDGAKPAPSRRAQAAPPSRTKKIAPGLWRAPGFAAPRPLQLRAHFGQSGRKSPSTDGRPAKGIRSNWPSPVGAAAR